MAWIGVVWQLRISFSGRRTFLWAVVILASFSVRTDLAGVTSFVRSHWLVPSCYRRLLGSFHSRGVDLGDLRRLWVRVCLKIFSPYLYRAGDRIVLIGDGLKNPKEGRKMPGVKSCHQESSNNSKAQYVMAHSCQAISVLARSIGSCFAVPLCARIHEGIVFSNRDNRTLLDKLLSLIGELGFSSHFILLADAYYASGRFVKSLLREGNHLISRVRSNAVAYIPYLIKEGESKKRGRPRVYGEKIKLRDLFGKPELFTSMPSPLSGEEGTTILVLTRDLIWRPLGAIVRFVWVIHPIRGNWLLISSDISLKAIQIIELYGFRFKIEVTFKQAIHVLGTFSYHFWMKAMKKIRRGGGDQYLHRTSEEYRNGVRRKLSAYELHIQLGFIAQGLLQYLAIAYHKQIWQSFSSWMRTMNPKHSPSERVVAMVLQERLPEFLHSLPKTDILKKFLENKVDWSRCPTYQLAA